MVRTEATGAAAGAGPGAGPAAGSAAEPFADASLSVCDALTTSSSFSAVFLMASASSMPVNGGVLFIHWSNAVTCATEPDILWKMSPCPSPSRKCSYKAVHNQQQNINKQNITGEKMPAICMEKL